MEQVYLGQGIKYPLELVGGSIQLQRNYPLVIQSIIEILNTPKGTRFFNPDYGSRLKEMLFEPNDEVLQDLLKVFIYEAIRDWEKRAKYVSTSFTFNDTGAVMCEISVRILPSNRVESFIYPFYRELKY